MTLNLTLEKAQSMVEAAIAEMGADYVYPNAGGSCQYVDTAYQGVHFEEVVHARGCIVGHAFINELNLDLEGLASSYVNDEGSGSFLEYLKDEGLITYEEDGEAEKYLRYLQRSQDTGRPWGEAHEQAKLGNTWSSIYENYIAP